MSGLAALVLASALQGPAAGPPLARLAESFADQVRRLAAGRHLQLDPFRDGTGAATQMARDLTDLVQVRLGAQTPTGPRLHVIGVMAEGPGRLTLAARIVEEPDGRLVDVVSAAIELDAGVLALYRQPPSAGGGRVQEVLSRQTLLLDEPVLDLAFLGERLIVLSTGAVSLYAWDAETALARVTRVRLAEPAEVVRAPAGLVMADEAESTFWVLTTGSEHALLFAAEKERLVQRFTAAALPWPGAPEGLRYEPGTNRLVGLPAGPVLTTRRGGGGAAVGPEGRLLLGSGPAGDLRVGPTLAWIEPSLLLASTADPPGSADRILVLSASAPSADLRGAIPVAGAVRALAARGQGTSARVVAAVGGQDGAERLLVLDFRLTGDLDAR